MNIADRLLSPYWRFHPSAQPNIISLYGRDEFRSWAGDLVNAIPDFRATIHDTVAEGDLVALRWTIAGTQTGEYMGAPATRRISITSQLSRSFCDPSSSIYGMGITISWALYFLLICIITLAMDKHIHFLVALFTVYGLVMYGVDKNRLFPIITRAVLISLATLVFIISAMIV